MVVKIFYCEKELEKGYLFVLWSSITSLLWVIDLNELNFEILFYSFGSEFRYGTVFPKHWAPSPGHPALPSAPWRSTSACGSLAQERQGHRPISGQKLHPDHGRTLIDQPGQDGRPRQLHLRGREHRHHQEEQAGPSQRHGYENHNWTFALLLLTGFARYLAGFKRHGLEDHS